MTQGVSEYADADSISAIAVQAALFCHARHEWGNLCEHDQQVNRDALQYGGRIISVWVFPQEAGQPEQKFWIITEADRSYTTILLPEEY